MSENHSAALRLRLLGRVEPQNVVREAYQRPFAAYFVDTPHQELSESASLLDLAKDRLHYRLACRVDCFAGFGLQLTFHPLHPRRIFRQPAARAGFPIFIMLLPLRGDVTGDAPLRFLFGIQLFQVLLRAITAVGKYLCWSCLLYTSRCV